MNEEDEIKVELPEDEKPEITVEQLGLEPEKPVVVEKAAAEQKPEVTPEEGIEKLKADLEAARTEAQTNRVRAEHAENVARTAQTEVVTARTEAQDSNLATINSAITTLETQKLQLKQNLRDAFAGQDVDAIAEIQDAMSTNAQQLAELRRGKEYIEKAPKPQVEHVQDPVEIIASQLSPRSASWVRAHPEFARTNAGILEMQAADAYAQRNGHKPDTDEYFAAVEERLGLRQPVEIQKEQPRMTQPPAAPPSRGGNGTGSKPQTIRLTREQVEAAEASGLTVQEYAKNLMALKAEGLLQ